MLAVIHVKVDLINARRGQAVAVKSAGNLCWFQVLSVYNLIDCQLRFQVPVIEFHRNDATC